MNDWHQNMHKQFTEYSKKFIPEHLHQHIHEDNSFSEKMMNGPKMVSEFSKKMSSSVEELVKDKTEMLQNHLLDMISMFKKMASATSHEMAFATHAEHSKKLFEKLLDEFKQLCKISGSAGMEAFEMMNDALRKNMLEIQHFMNHKHDHSPKKTNKTSKSASKKRKK